MNVKYLTEKIKIKPRPVPSKYPDMQAELELGNKGEVKAIHAPIVDTIAELSGKP